MAGARRKTASAKSASVDVLSALADLVRDGALRGPAEPPGLFSASDHARKERHDREWGQRQVRHLVDAGKVEYVGRYPRPDITGRMQPTPLYRLMKGD